MSRLVKNSLDTRCVTRNIGGLCWICSVFFSFMFDLKRERDRQTDRQTDRHRENRREEGRERQRLIYKKEKKTVKIDGRTRTLTDRR